MLVVRTAQGELMFESEHAVWQGVRTGTVSIEDLVQKSGSTDWCPVAELAGGAPPGLDLARYHWYLLAGILVALLVAFGPTWPTALMVITPLSTHSVWMKMRGKPR